MKITNLQLPKIKSDELPVIKPYELPVIKPIYISKEPTFNVSDYIKEQTEKETEIFNQQLRENERINEKQAKKNKWNDRFIGSAFTIAGGVIIYCLTNLSKVVSFFKNLF